MKLFHKIASISLGLSLALGVGVVASRVGSDVAETKAAASTYQKVASLSAGKEVLIVSHSSSGQYYLMDAVTAATSAGPKYITCSLSNSTITGDYDTHLFTVAASSTNWKFSTGTKYLKWSSTSSNTAIRINTGDSDNTWTYSNGTMKFSSATRYLGVYTAGTDWRSYNSSTAANYSGTGANIEFYEKSTPAATYTVSFDANGGTGSMSPVNDVSGSYTLPANGFTAPNGKAFAGWKAGNAGDLILAGASYNVTAAVTFYAQWADARTLTYNANGGTGTMTDEHSPYASGATVTVLANAFTAPDGKRFAHWNTSNDDLGTSYNPNATFTINANVVLYAIWEDMPNEVEITYDSYKDNLPASGYSALEWSANGIQGMIYTIKNSDSVIQFQKVTSYIYNTKAISGYITGIQATVQSGKSKNALVAFVGDSVLSAPDAQDGEENNTTWSWTFDASDHFSYFRLDSSTASGANYISRIVVSYEKVAQVAPTGITLNDSSDISMDTYGYGRRKLVATVQPFNNNDDTVNWGTSNSSVVTVSDGILTPRGVGSTTVYATTGNYVSDVATPGLKVSVNVTVTQAQYKKATFSPTSYSAAAQSDDYINSGSVTLGYTGDNHGTFDTDKNALQLAAGKNATFTISGYTGMKITGIDMVLSSNGNAGTGSLTVTAGSTDILEIETAPFSDASWNGQYDANHCELFKDSTDYIVQSAETIKFSFACSVNSLYIYSVSIRYLDVQLENWATNFLSTVTCSGVTQENPDGAITAANPITAWTTVRNAFNGITDDDLKNMAKTISGNESGTVIQQALARYDLIIRKYGTGTYNDFIGRFSEGGINYQASNMFNRTSDNNSNSGVAAIAIIAAATSLVTVGAYFLLKKKHA